MTTAIIFITGKKSSGKDTLANYLRTTVGEDKTVILAFADPLKAACKAIYLFTDEQLHDEKLKEVIDPRWGVTPRRTLQREGDLHNSVLPLLIPELKLPDGPIFVQNMGHRIRALLSLPTPPTYIIISDGRFPKEHEFVKTFSNSISIRLLRRTEGPTDTHASELGDFQTDLSWDNNGTIGDLRVKADHLLNSGRV